MAGKIYVLQRALFHADTPEELTELAQAATKVIREGGGAIENLEGIQQIPEGAPDAGTFAQFIDYWVLKTSFDDLMRMAEVAKAQAEAAEVMTKRDHQG